MDRINTVVIAYNTNLVAAADAPKTWDDLLDPKWQGKMAVELSDTELLGNMANAWGQARAYAFWDGIAAQKPEIVEGHTELAEALAAGTYAISPTTYAYRIEKLKADGQPIEWVRTDPVFATPSILGLAAQAPHPVTAKLFIDWLLSERGQVVIRDMGRIPARPGISSDPPALTEGLNLYYTPIAVTDHFAEYMEKWNNLFAPQ
jgi:iron(III) transport system substrate-binding protein